MLIYRALGMLTPRRAPPPGPESIVLVLPCCIGDVVLATATLRALRRGYPRAHIAWAVGSWSRPAIEDHDALDALIDLGPGALPRDLRRLARQLRGFDLLVSLVRSPRLSAAALLSGVPHRAGVDSVGRGFGYTVRAPIQPAVTRHEADIYLDVARALGLDVEGCYANVPVHDADRAAVRDLLAAQGIDPARFVVLNPAGGHNPGMTLVSKRWPTASFAALADHLAAAHDVAVVLVAGPDDGPLLDAVAGAMAHPAFKLAGTLSFGQIAALAALARIYIGNDTGLTHLAAAAGGRTAMIFGPSDPARYAPFTPNSIALWQPVDLDPRGVVGAAGRPWDWARDGIGVAAVTARIDTFLTESAQQS
jgi:ADP-heptose:LPS heptosyltransferase